MELSTESERVDAEFVRLGGDVTCDAICWEKIGQIGSFKQSLEHGILVCKLDGRGEGYAGLEYPSA